MEVRRERDKERKQGSRREGMSEIKEERGETERGVGKMKEERQRDEVGEMTEEREGGKWERRERRD